MKVQINLIEEEIKELNEATETETHTKEGTTEYIQITQNKNNRSLQWKQYYFYCETIFLLMIFFFSKSLPQQSLRVLTILANT